LQEPLRTVGSYASLLARRYEGKLDEQADKYIRHLIDGAKRMQTLIQELLAYSRAGTDALNYEAVDMATVLGRAEDNLRLAIAERHAHITKDLLPSVEVDAGRLAQVFQNLIGNALKFGKPDEPPAIHIGSWRHQGEWVFVVSDNGIGFEPQYAQKIFLIFQRLHHVGAYTGTGMGLAICKRIIEAHGGRIWAESQPGSGSRFFFTLPAQARSKRGDDAPSHPPRIEQIRSSEAKYAHSARRG
jgi:light-regulated signal transduction histidine kinase (bacteriophytochrome)